MNTASSMASINSRTYATLACDFCKGQKKKCDRILPECSTCIKKLVKCNYEENRDLHEIRMLRSKLELVAKRSGLLTSSSLTQTPSGPIIKYPIPSQWYMEFLLNYYFEFSFPSSARLDLDRNHSFSRQEWIQASFADPGMFHSILFASSSQLEVLRGEHNNPISHYHRRHATLALLSQISASPKVPDTSIAAALYLWHYESMNNNVREARIHKQGVEQMVKAKGGLGSLRLGGYLAHLITLIDIGYAVLTATRPSFSDELAHQRPKTPVSLLSPTLRRSDAELNASGIERTLASWLRGVHTRLLQLDLGSRPETGHDASSLKILDEPAVIEIASRSTLSAAIWYASRIQLLTLQSGIPFTSEQNQLLVEKLRGCLVTLPHDESSDVESELMVWLCFTGAAAAVKHKTWFLAKVGPIVMALGSGPLQLFKHGLVRFCDAAHYLASAKSDDADAQVNISTAL